ncbi:hypothetical protein ACH5RR_013379 [Cinchona calisaya]|uniref:Uncharacterized protein n=1 Tax=Cinchona calisaya TaxID=153742 RepID=A0ABD3A2I3_9GENT
MLRGIVVEKRDLYQNEEPQFGSWLRATTNRSSGTGKLENCSPSKNGKGNQSLITSDGPNEVERNNAKVRVDSEFKGANGMDSLKQMNNTKSQHYKVLNEVDTEVSIPASDTDGSQAKGGELEI